MRQMWIHFSNKIQALEGLGKNNPKHLLVLGMYTIQRIFSPETLFTRNQQPKDVIYVRNAVL